MHEISYQKFLTTRICDLRLDINESLAPYFRRLRKELKVHRIPLWPDFYFGNEWGCVNKKISVSVPFYLATQKNFGQRPILPSYPGIEVSRGRCPEQ
jgi:hypothetical protein